MPLNGKLFLLGGQDASTDLRDVESYDPTTQTWTTLPSMLRVRNSFVAVALGKEAPSTVTNPAP